MNILYIWDADYPWDVRVEKICNTLLQDGHEVHIAARNLKKLPTHEISNGIEIHRISPWQNDHLNYALSFPVFFNPIWRFFLDRVIKENTIDLIIVRDLPMAIAGIWAGKRHKIPMIFDMAEDYVAMICDIWKARKFQGMNLIVRNPYLAKLVEHYVLKEADHIFVVVEEAKALVIRRGVLSDRVTIVGNTPPLETFNISNNVQGSIIKMICDRYSVIYTGGIQMGRGIQVVFEAIPEVIREIPDFLFVIVGDGYATPILKNVAEKNNIQDHVLWVGWVEHARIFEYIKACRVGIIPHFVTDHVSTTIPNKIFDYMGLGLPVIASDAAPMKRILEEEECGKVFRDRDPKDLARCLKEIYRSCENYGENGENAIWLKYNWNVDSRVILSLLERIMNRIISVVNVNDQMTIQVMNVTGSRRIFKKKLDDFIMRMDTEKRYFPLSLERALRSETVLLALHEGEVVGFGGVEIKYRIPRSTIMLDRKYHGKGLSKALMKMIHTEAEKKHHIILGVIEKHNKVALDLDLSIGYTNCGERNNLYYLFFPFTATGKIIIKIISKIFPIIKILDKIRLK